MGGQRRVYLHGAFLFYEASKGRGELTPVLNLRKLPSLGRDIYGLVEERIDARLPNWRRLVSREITHQI